MKNNKQPSRYRLTLTLAICLIFLAGWPWLVLAGPTLPPRNPPPTTPQGGKENNQNDDDDDGGGEPLGSYIRLQTSSGAWAVVQWQDSAGGWHNVEGWNGVLSSGGVQEWWVASKDFGTGPFRWVVKQGANGAVVGTSEIFNLPGGASAGVLVSVP